jgi:site-specific DNA-cytosine methylase
MFAAFAGMDLLGKGIKKTFPVGKCVGGSEKNNTARLLFKRQHGFEPFRDQQLVPDYAYDKIFMVTTGAPCVAFSLAGKQKGQTDARGLHYVEQADGYIRAKVPVILFEQVPEARHILNKDWKARDAGKSPQDQLVDKLRNNGYTVPNGPDGQAGIILNAADLGGVLDRKRLFTVAVIDELWEHSKGDETFKWPEQVETKRSIKEIFREPVRSDHLAPEHMKQHFKPRERYTKTGVHYKFYKDEGLGEWYVFEGGP